MIIPRSVSKIFGSFRGVAWAELETFEGIESLGNFKRWQRVLYGRIIALTKELPRPFRLSAAYDMYIAE